MFFFGRRVRILENLISLQRSEISDLRAAMRDERLGFASERKELLDRLIACTQPAAHREIHPREPISRVGQVMKEMEKEQRPKRIHFPGYVKSFAPPYPAVPPEFDKPRQRREEETPS